MNEVNVGGLQTSRGQKAFHVDERDVLHPANADLFTLEVRNRFDVRLCIHRIRGGAERADNNFDTCALVCGAHKIWKPAMRNVHRPYGKLLRRSRARRIWFNAYPALFVKPEFLGHIEWPLRRTRRYHSSQNLGLSVRRDDPPKSAGRQCYC